MTAVLPQVFLCRHGETEWSRSGKHTGLSDIPLTTKGEDNAQRLGKRLQGICTTHVLTSPLQRAARTCELAGFGRQAVVDPDLVEWDYGDYEGKTSTEIHLTRPDWQLFRDGCPNGESVTDVGARADRVIHRLRSQTGNTLIFSSSHFLRTLAARWVGLEPSCGQIFFLDTASLSIVGYEHLESNPVIRDWNDCSHLLDD